MARRRNRRTCRNINGLAGVVYSYLRNKSTSAESVLWNQLKSKNLEALGFTVLRFENRFVFQEPEIVLNEIKKVFRKRLSFDK